MKTLILLAALSLAMVAVPPVQADGIIVTYCVINDQGVYPACCPNGKVFQPAGPHTAWCFPFPDLRDVLG